MIILTGVVALTSASTFFPGLGLDVFGFEAEADNSGQNGSKSPLLSAPYFDSWQRSQGIQFIGNCN